jgi:hypothetical protein
VPLDVDELKEWMALWAQQIVERHYPRWTYTAEQFRDEGWRIVRCDHSLHPLLMCGDYCYAGPPLYDKRAHPLAARFMWFSSIRFAFEQGLQWFDLGGGDRKTWRKAVAERDESYKWQYVTRKVKEHPELEEPWYSQICPCGYRQLVLKEEPCRRCSS